MIIRTALAAYAADRAPVVASPERLRSTVNPLDRLLGDLAVADLTRQAVAAYVAGRVAEGVQPQTARRELITLRAAIRMQWRDRAITDLPYIQLPARARPRHRVLTQPEIKRLRGACCDPRDALVLDLLLGTGARLRAIIELTWDRVDLDNKIIDLRAPHPREARRKHRAVVPIAARLATALRRAQRQAVGEHVIAWRSDTTIQRHLHAIARAAGINGVTPHVMRHTAATHMIRAVRLVVASRLLGHKCVATTEQEYGHLMVDDLEPGAKVLNGLLA